MSRQIFLPVALAGALSLLAGCETGEQPEECALFLSCFYPADDSLSPDSVDGRQQSDAMRDEAQAAFGAQGECWRNGANDRFFHICRRTCVDILVDECTRGTDRPCVEGSANNEVFKPQEWDGDNTPTCSALSQLQGQLADEANGTSTAASGS